MTDWIVKPDKASLVAEASRPDRNVEYLAEVAGECRTSKGSAEDFSKWGPGPTTYRIPVR